MNDIIERLRSGEDGLEYAAADEIERLRAECQRLAGEVSRAHKDALGWMERAAAVNAEIEAARQQGRIEGATKLQAERDAARAEVEADALASRAVHLERARALLEGSGEMGGTRHAAAKEPGHE